MGIALIKIKIMPESPDLDLEEIESASEKIISEEKGEKTKLEREPIAFGINAVIATFSRDENLDSDKLLKKLQEIPNVSSAEIIDYRRAFG